jgi:3-phosphoglycerate kinase
VECGTGSAGERIGHQFGLAEKISYVRSDTYRSDTYRSDTYRTGGGAMLEYLEGKVLPGIAAIVG